jgi:ribonuclease HI
MENKGPTGVSYKQTSNRAELRAVIAALMFRSWSADCNRSWRSLVVATDSEYVAINATERIERWEKTGWKRINQQGKTSPIKNQDLWKLLLSVVRQLHGDGVNVAFWRIPREWNQRADKFAKEFERGKGKVPNFSVIVPTGPTSVDFRPMSELINH